MGGEERYPHDRWIEMTFLALLFFVYFAPAVVASSRSHTSSAAIWFANFFVGWTVIGWVLCLIWALSGRREVVLYPAVLYGLPRATLGHPPRWQTSDGGAERVCSACYRPLPEAARYCSMCGGNASLIA